MTNKEVSYWAWARDQVRWIRQKDARVTTSFIHHFYGPDRNTWQWSIWKKIVEEL